MKTSGLARAATLTVGAGAIALVAHTLPGTYDATAPVVHQSTRTPVDAAALVCPGGSTAQKATVALSSAPRDLASMLRTGGGVRHQVGSAPAVASTLSRGTSVAVPASEGPFTVTASGPLAPGLSATQFVSTGSALAARTCTNSTDEAWIPVGDKQAGRLLTLDLVNAGSHAAAVDIDVRAEDGDIVAAGIADKAVPAHSRVEFNLPADALRHAATVVHVRSEGGAVQASVRDRSDSGDVKGLEQVGQYASASTRQLIPAVAVSAGRARVRLVAPDGQAAVVRLQAWGSGESVSHDSVVTVHAGRTKDVELTGLRGDVAAVRATSERDVVASALGLSAPKGAADFAWSPAAPDLGDAAGFSLDGAGADGVLALMSDGHARTVTVVTQGASGAKSGTKRVIVPADGFVTAPVAKGASVWIAAPTRDGVSGVAASVLVGDRQHNGALTNLPLVAAPWVRTPVAVVQG